MCGRFTLTQSAETIAEAFDLADLPPLAPRYNIAPTQPAPAVRMTGSQRQFTYLTWGLVPSWAKDPAMGARMINARAETVAEKPAFRSALKYRRCLIVADGFYEWQLPSHAADSTSKGKSRSAKQPFYFCLADRRPFAFAGLWEHWQSPDGSEIESCTLITTAANDLMQHVHDRMPVILQPQDYDLWLDPDLQSPQALQPLLVPYPSEAMTHYPVSTQVNSPRNDSPTCVEPIAV